jgi:hypothetical protein
VFKEYKRPKDAQPHDKIMRSEGFGGVAHNKQNAKQGPLCLANPATAEEGHGMSKPMTELIRRYSDLKSSLWFFHDQQLLPCMELYADLFFTVNL